MNFFSKQLATLQNALAGIGFDHKSLEEDPAALATFIEDQKASAVQEATAASATALEEAAAAVTAAEKEQASASAQSALFASKLSAYEDGIKAAGIKVDAELFSKLTHESDEAAVAAAAEEIESAVKARISVHAAEVLAANGHTVKVAEVPAANPASPKQPTNLHGIARIAAALK